MRYDAQRIHVVLRRATGQTDEGAVVHRARIEEPAVAVGVGADPDDAGTGHRQDATRQAHDLVRYLHQGAELRRRGASLLPTSPGLRHDRLQLLCRQDWSQPRMEAGTTGRGLIALVDDNGAAV